MGLFSRSNKKIEDKNIEVQKVEIEKEKEDINLTIQFTPVATYLYISEEGSPNLYDGCLEMEDLDEKYFLVSGQFISLELDSILEVEKTIDKFGLKNSILPIIQIKVRPF